MEPQVSFSCLSGGKKVILAVILSYRNPKSTIRLKLHRLAYHPLFPFSSLFQPLQIAGVCQFLPDLL